MHLVIDANVLIAELLRQRGRELISSPGLSLHASDKILNEASYELKQRLERLVVKERFTAEAGTILLETALQAIATYVIPYSEASYAYLEDEAKERIPRDPDDWHTVALAIYLDLPIWTQDSDFLGCGCPTWTTDTLKAKLKRDLG